ncbi:MAG: hypothetical protein WC858_03000 [Parcubacteria group bacterium]|jgi:hypothetical protein
MVKIDRESQIPVDPTEEIEKSDPRRIKGVFHNDPIEVCYHIQDMIDRMKRNGAKLPSSLDEKLLRLSGYMGYVRDAYYDIEEATLLKPALVPREELENTIKSIDDLTGDPQFLKAVNVLFDTNNPANYSLSSLGHTEPETKEELELLFKDYADLFRYFAKEK